jgi:hypothetical protein
MFPPHARSKEGFMVKSHCELCGGQYLVWKAKEALVRSFPVKGSDFEEPFCACTEQDVEELLSLSFIFAMGVVFHGVACLLFLM